MTAHATTLSRLTTRPTPLPPPVWLTVVQGLGRGGLVGTMLACVLIGLEVGLGTPYPALDSLIGVALGFSFVFASEGVVALVWRLGKLILRRLRADRPLALWSRLPARHIGWTLGAALFVVGDTLFPGSFLSFLAYGFTAQAYIPVIAVTWTLVSLARRADVAPRGRATLLGLALALNASAVGWLVWPGHDGYLARAEAVPAQAVAPLALPNPALPGPLAVNHLVYGSGVDQRPAYGPSVELVTQPVDGAAVFAGFGDLGNAQMRWLWGFDTTALPLNGQVWYPAGDGPFPLVLMVHGNHKGVEPSEIGYAYLGEHLASHGYLAVSVDESFLNIGFPFGLAGAPEMPVRAWLLLKHLQQWRAWNAAPGTPFYGRVDLDRVALLGHSRGGEAVVHAAALNTHLYPPVSNAAQPDAFGFGIRAVVAIAPSDGYYRPGGRPLTLGGADYLLLQGGHDGDVTTIMGVKQYQRVQFDANPAGFKALVYLYRANHGQFNTVWGDHDLGAVTSLGLNRRPLLSGDEQRGAARLFVTAFLDASLRGQAGYRGVFRAPAGVQPWLPQDIVVTQYADASLRTVSAFEATARLDQNDLAGGTAEAVGMRTWQREVLRLRDSQAEQGNTVLRLGWEAGSRPSYTLGLPGETVAAWGLTPQDSLTFGLASALDEPTPLGVTVEVATADGVQVALPLDQFGAVHPPLRLQTAKSDRLAQVIGMTGYLPTPFERVLQTYDLPLAAFQQADPRFDPARLAAVRFRFDGRAGGAVYLDQVGFRRTAR